MLSAADEEEEEEDGLTRVVDALMCHMSDAAAVLLKHFNPITRFACGPA
jgi:hypothetical protein